MRTRHTVSEISDKLRDTARDGAQQASEAVNTVVTGSTSAGRDTYRLLANRTGNALAGVDKAVSRNPVGALAAALGAGLVLGLLARR